MKKPVTSPNRPGPKYLAPMGPIPKRSFINFEEKCQYFNIFKQQSYSILVFIYLSIHMSVCQLCQDGLLILVVICAVNLPPITSLFLSSPSFPHPFWFLLSPYLTIHQSIITKKLCNFGTYLFLLLVHLLYIYNFDFFL